MNSSQCNPATSWGKLLTPIRQSETSISEGNQGLGMKPLKADNGSKS